jgi:uncharacterized membrane protein YjjP (DUF1212 family)
MNNWTAPLLVALSGIPFALLSGEFVVLPLAIALALLGYAINKAGN